MTRPLVAGGVSPSAALAVDAGTLEAGTFAAAGTNARAAFEKRFGGRDRSQAGAGESRTDDDG